MVSNLFAGLPAAAESAERYETLFSQPGLRITRIVSTGQASPTGFWYEQTEAEWVVLLSGSAGLYFEDESAVTPMVPGDWVLISAGRRHRVEWTDPEVPSVWLAVHFLVKTDMAI